MRILFVRGKDRFVAIWEQVPRIGEQIRVKGQDGVVLNRGDGGGGAVGRWAAGTHGGVLRWR
jgi:hypothetical protein